MKNKIRLLIILVLVLAAGIGFFVFQSWRTDQEVAQADSRSRTPSNNAQAYILPLSEPNYAPLLNSNVPKPQIDAKAVLVYDLRSSRSLYAKNEKEQLPIASLTKVMTAVAVLEKLNVHDVVTIPQEVVRVDGERQDLYANEKLTVENLIKIMLVGSSNDAAYALAWYAKSQNIDLVAQMNQNAVRLGMTHSSFLDPAGLNDSGYSTAQDLAKVVKDAFRFSVIWNTLAEPEIQVPAENSTLVHTVKNTNQLLGVLPDIIGGKTGNTNIALGCMILLVKVAGHDDTIISIVLGSHDRFGDTKKLVDWIQTAYSWTY